MLKFVYKLFSGENPQIKINYIFSNRHNLLLYIFYFFFLIKFNYDQRKKKKQFKKTRISYKFLFGSTCMYNQLTLTLVGNMVTSPRTRNKKNEQHTRRIQEYVPMRLSTLPCPQQLLIIIRDIGQWTPHIRSSTTCGGLCLLLLFCLRIS